MRRHTLRVDGVSLECRRHGTATGSQPTLVFLHDGLGCADIWGDFPESLSRHTGLAGLVYSRAGYGRSDPVPLPRPLDYHRLEAKQVLPAVLDAAGIRRAILVGHSDGATIALLYGATPHAARAAGIVAMAPHVFNEELTIRSVAAMTKAYERGALQARLARYHGGNVDCAFRGWSDTWRHPRFRTWTMTQALPAVRCPVLVIQGDDDAFGSLRQVEAIAKGVGGAVRVHILRCCGHVPYRERPAITTASIAAFVRDLSWHPRAPEEQKERRS